MSNVINFNNQLTCIINVRNGEKYIEETINSVLMQTIKVNIIVIDNHSTDSTENIVKKFNSISYWKTPYPCSLGEARNFSIDKINTEYVAWLDSDDLWESDFALISLNAFIQNESIAFTSSLGYLIDEKSELYPDKEQLWIENKELGIYTKGIELVKCIENYRFLGPWCGFVFKVNFIKKVGGFDKTLTFSEDFDLITKLLNIGSSTHINKRICKYRIHSSQETQQLNEKSRINEIIYVLKKNKNSVNKIIIIVAIIKIKFNYYYGKYLINKNMPVNILNS